MPDLPVDDRLNVCIKGLIGGMLEVDLHNRPSSRDVQHTLKAVLANSKAAVRILTSGLKPIASPINFVSFVEIPAGATRGTLGSAASGNRSTLFPGATELKTESQTIPRSVELETLNRAWTKVLWKRYWYVPRLRLMC
jgi:hypothetical protein